MIEPNTSVSSGTMRAADLIPTFIDTLENLGEQTFALATEWLFLSRGYFRRNDGEWVLSTVDNEEVIDQTHYLLDDLFDLLDNLSPPGTSFGSHPGDGSDYGWWTIEDF